MFACDLAVAAEDAKFGTTAINVGLICLGPAIPMVRSLGRKKTLEMVLAGDIISAAEAEKLGLINKVVPPEDLEASTMKLAAKLTKKRPPGASNREDRDIRHVRSSIPSNLSTIWESSVFASLCAYRGCPGRG